jgi:hypothetical protein
VLEHLAALAAQGPSAVEIALYILARAGGHGRCGLPCPGRPCRWDIPCPGRPCHWGLPRPGRWGRQRLWFGRRGAIRPGRHPHRPRWPGCWVGAWTPTRKPLFLATPAWTAWLLAVVAYVRVWQPPLS